MYSSRLWWIFLTMIAIPTLFFTWSSIHRLRDYYDRAEIAHPVHISWSYEQIGHHDTFAPIAHYTFQVNGKEYSGKTKLSEPLFRDEWIADEVLNSLKNRTWKVWYQASHPEHSTLERHFPAKDLFSAIALIILLGYFTILGQQVRKKLTEV